MMRERSRIVYRLEETPGGVWVGFFIGGGCSSHSTSASTILAAAAGTVQRDFRGCA